MKLHEYQSKTIFSKYGISIPKGRVAATAQEARQVAEELGGRVVIKAQVLGKSSLFLRQCKSHHAVVYTISNPNVTFMIHGNAR